MRNAETLIIVESPAKASTIERYLGGGFKVLASYGHVRDLLSKNGSVEPDNDFNMIWTEPSKTARRVNDIVSAAKKSSNILLATDPDREGEAIAWHISEIVKERLGAAMPSMQRVVFHEITKNAVLSALQSPRSINQRLVDAYLARRALDYLVGYSISPVLWRKLPGAKSAGRVQSVALRMIVEREQEIEMFNTQEYWSIDGIFSTIASENSRRKATQEFRAKLVSFNNKKLAKLDISTEAQAKQMCSELAPLSYSAADIEKKQVHRNPAPPFTTSTMQQEASRKLGFGAMRTMRVAQFLYEGVQVDGEKTGLITYMRTDSTNLSKEGVAGMRDFIAKNYGDKYLPKSSRVYKTKAKNAQEAHEAIRPTDISKRPGDLAKFLDKDQLALYELIWKRAIASQMENAVFDQVSVDLVDTAKKHVFRAVGTTQVFDGFLRVYQEGTDEADGSETEHGAHGNAVMHWKGGASANEDERQLPVLQLNEVVSLGDIAKAQHFTQPPPRFTEASIVKRLEELGIGRPSTYAPLIQVLQDRGYAALEKRQFMPSDRGRIVTGFLTNFCRKYVEYDFTAHMEDELDDISNGEIEWRRVMTNFWTEFSQTISSMKDIPITEVINRLEENLALYIFKNLQDRKCDKCGEGVVGLRLSKFGAFLGCNRYPECLNRKSIGADTNAAEEERFEAVELGVDPSDNAKIFLRKGPFGFYVQAETIGKRGKVKIKRITIPQEIVPQNISFQEALFLKGLPKTIGELDGNEVRVSIGRFGPYVCCGDVSASIPKATSIMAVTLDDAISLIKKKLARQTQRQQSKAPKGG